MEWSAREARPTVRRAGLPGNWEDCCVLACGPCNRGFRHGGFVREGAYGRMAIGQARRSRARHARRDAVGADAGAALWGAVIPGM